MILDDPVRSAADEIASEIEENWKDRTSPILLSALGMRISEQTKEIMNAERQSLRRFVLNHLSDRVRFVPMTRFGGGYAPISQTADISDPDLEKLYIEQRPTPAPRYDRDIWRAFKETIPEGKSRVITLDGKISFFDQCVSEAPPANSYSLQPSEQPAKTGTTPSDEDLVNAINNWGNKNKIDENKLIYKRYEKTDPSIRRPIREHLDVKNQSIFDILSTEELSRISIPADIVAAAFLRIKNA